MFVGGLSSRIGFQLKAVTLNEDSNHNAIDNHFHGDVKLNNSEESLDIIPKWYRLSHWRDAGYWALVRHVWAMLLYRMHYWFWDSWFEPLEKMATRGTVLKDDLSPVNTTHADLSYEYGASPRLVVDWILDAIKVDLTQYSFIDYGSGRGRVLLSAARKPFQSVRGIEFSSVLHEQAKRNIAGYPVRHHVCRDVQSVCCDALEYGLPDSDCVLYFYNPFEVELLDKVIRQSLDMAQVRQRRIIIIYYNSKHHQTLANNKRLKSRPLSHIARFKLRLFSPHPVQIYDLIID